MLTWEVPRGHQTEEDAVGPLLAVNHITAEDPSQPTVGELVKARDVERVRHATHALSRAPSGNSSHQLRFTFDRSAKRTPQASTPGVAGSWSSH